MKRIALFLALCLVGIGPLFAQEENQPLSAENIMSKIQDIEEYLEECDRSPITEEHMPIYVEATKTWKEFKYLCAKGQFDQAIFCYKEKLPAFPVYIFNTTAQYYLLLTVIKPIAIEALPWKEAYALLVSGFELNLILTEGVIEMAKEKAGYIPGHYGALLNELLSLYVAGEEWKKAHEMIDHTFQAMQLNLDFSEAVAETIRAFQTSQVLSREGRKQEAKQAAESGLKMVLNAKRKDAEFLHSVKERFEELLRDLN